MIFTALGPEVPEPLGGPVAGAANSLLQAGILGALVVLLAVALTLVILKWNKSQEARVKDQKEMTRTLVDLTDGLKDALREVNGTSDAIKKAVDANTEAVKANTSASAQMERTLNETVRDAVRGAAYRRSSTPTGTPVAPPPPAAPPK